MYEIDILYHVLSMLDEKMLKEREKLVIMMGYDNDNPKTLADLPEEIQHIMYVLPPNNLSVVNDL